RMTMLPGTVKADLAKHAERVRALHQRDLRQGAGWVELPWALARKYPNAGREWAWQWVFPATRFYVDRATGQRRRHHLHEAVLPRDFQAKSGVFDSMDAGRYTAPRAAFIVLRGSK